MTPERCAYDREGAKERQKRTWSFSSVKVQQDVMAAVNLNNINAVHSKKNNTLPPLLLSKTPNRLKPESHSLCLRKIPL